jgi:hypothetical protein
MVLFRATSTMSHTQSLSGVNGSGLVQLNDCTCLGYTQTFECNVCGVGSTVWNGTFFDCENELELYDTVGIMQQLWIHTIVDHPVKSVTKEQF